MRPRAQPLGANGCAQRPNRCAGNPATGQTLQICVSWDGVNDSNSLTGAFTCTAVSGPASISTQVGCYAQDLTVPQTVQAQTTTAPGDAAATGNTFASTLDFWQVCVFGSATDAGGNTVSIPPYTCFS